MASRFITPLFDAGNGISPSDGAQLFFFITGTADLKNTFSDEAATTPNPNPVIADGDGLFPEIWITGRYKVVLKDKNGVQEWEEDPIIEGMNTGSTNINFETVADMVANTGLELGDFISVEDYATGNKSGVLFFKVVEAGTGTADGGAYIDLPNTTPALQAKQNFPAKLSIKMYGIAGDGTDEGAAINTALTAIGKDRTILFPGDSATYGTSIDIVPLSGQYLLGDGTGGDSIDLASGTHFKATSDSFSFAIIDMAAHCYIEGFKFDGNSVANSAIRIGAATNAFKAVITSNRFDDFTGNFIVNEVVGSTGPDSATISFNEFNGGAAGAGFISIVNGSDIDIYENRFVPDNYVDYLVKMTSTLNNSVGTISHNLCEGSNAGVEVSGYLDGIIIDADAFTVRGNNFQISPSDTLNLSNIRLRTGASGTNIRENNFQTVGATLTGSITAFADAGGGLVTVTSAAHGLTTGRKSIITGTTNYNGKFDISNITTNTFDITDTWVADDATGTFTSYAYNIAIDSGATNTLIDGSNFGWTVADGVSVDIDDNGTNTLINLGRSTAGQRFFLTPTMSIVAYDGGEQFLFDTDAVKLLFNNDINQDNWIGILAGVLNLNASSFLDLNAAATNKVRSKVGGVIGFEVTDDGSAGECEARIRDVTGASLERISIGAADSGGAGFRSLRIPN